MVRLSRRKDRFSTPRALATDDARPTRYGQTLTAPPPGAAGRRAKRATGNAVCACAGHPWPAWRSRHHRSHGLGARARRGAPDAAKCISDCVYRYIRPCVGFLSHRPHHPTTTVFAGQMRHRLETKVAPWRPRDQHGSWVMLCDTGMHARAPFAALLSTGLPLRSPIARNPNLEPLTQLSPRRTGSRRLAALRAR